MPKKATKRRNSNNKDDSDQEEDIKENSKKEKEDNSGYKKESKIPSKNSYITITNKEKEDNNIINIEDNNINKEEKSCEKNRSNNKEDKEEEKEEQISKKKFRDLINKYKELEKKSKELEKENKELKKKDKAKDKQILELKKEIESLKSSNDKEEESDEIGKSVKKKFKKNKKQENFLESTEEIKVFQSISEYPKPTLVGLQNVGATCFMNSTLQCLSHTKELTNYFLKKRNLKSIMNNNIQKANPNEYQLAPVYYELIQNLWNVNGGKYYAPYNFMNRVNDMNPLFKKGEAGDAKDFIIFVLEQMHRELSKSLNIKQIEEPSTLNQYDKNNAFANFFNEFTKNTSIISDLFFGFNETTNICQYCKNRYGGINYPICYNYGIFNIIIFPLEEVRLMKNKTNMNNINNLYQGPSNMVSITDCFIYNQKTDLFTGENKNYCNLCYQLADSHYTSKIYISPNILILILNRGKGNIYKVKIDFQLQIDITDFVIQKDKPKLIYNLYGVITHLGKSGPNAHFIATCKSPVDNKWYRYNDAIVDPVYDFNKDIYDFGTPYILFYEKEN